MMASRPLRRLWPVTLIVTMTLPVSAQKPADLHLFQLVDVGPVDGRFDCTAIPQPFALPWFNPDPGHGSGPGVPLEPAAPTKAEREREKQIAAEERRFLPSVAEDAVAGNPAASFAVGFAFASGTGVKRDEASAVTWYALAARQGHSQAATLVAYRFARGIGVPRDDSLAAEWYLTGAAQGDRPAMIALGLLHLAGRGVPLDVGAAIRWWEGAGEGLALRLLGDAYACGIGVEPSYERAIELYRRSPEFSALRLGHMYRHTCGAGCDDSEAAKWFERESDLGHPEAQIELSEMYRLGHGVDRNPGHAYMLAVLAAWRLPPGALQDRAMAMRDRAAGLIGPEELESAENLARALLESHKIERASCTSASPARPSVSPG